MERWELGKKRIAWNLLVALTLSPHKNEAHISKIFLVLFIGNGTKKEKINLHFLRIFLILNTSGGEKKNHCPH